MASELHERRISAYLVECSLPRSLARLEGLGRKFVGFSMWRRSLRRRLIAVVRRPDVRWVIVTNGRELDAETVEEVRDLLRIRGGGIASFLCDDPFSDRHFDAEWVRSLPAYSLVACSKRRVIPDLKTAGCANVCFVRFAYHPPIHRPVARARFGDFDGVAECDVAFAGNADTDRVPVMAQMVRRASELSLRLYGDGWSRDRSLSTSHHPQVTGLAYSAAMCAAKACPCLVRRANRDGHVMRTFELPAMGAVMLAERTEEHLELFDEDVHCLYWSCPEELAEKARFVRDHAPFASRIAQAGHRLMTSGANTYSDRAAEIIARLRGVL